MRASRLRGAGAIRIAIRPRAVAPRAWRCVRGDLAVASERGLAGAAIDHAQKSEGG